MSDFIILKRFSIDDGHAEVDLFRLDRLFNLLALLGLNLGDLFERFLLALSNVVTIRDF